MPIDALGTGRKKKEIYYYLKKLKLGMGESSLSKWNYRLIICWNHSGCANYKKAQEKISQKQKKFAFISSENKKSSNGPA